jgi:SnoaL-like protein
MEIEVLLAEREIYRQLVRFARAMDERDWDVLAAICTDDISAEFGTGEVLGPDAVIGLIRSYLENCGTTQHLLGNVLIDVAGKSATSESYVADLHLARDENRDIQFRTLGNYSDTWVRRGGDWLLSKRVKNNRAIVGTMDVFGN